MENRLRKGARDIAEDIGLKMEIEKVGNFGPVEFDKNCVEKIVERCFYDVIWRFQKNNNKETKLLFDYKVQDGWTNPNKKKTDLQYGIKLNPEAMKFFRQHNASLKKSVILEWTRFLEIFNIGMPKLVPKIEPLCALQYHSMLRQS